MSLPVHAWTNFFGLFLDSLVGIIWPILKVLPGFEVYFGFLCILLGMIYMMEMVWVILKILCSFYRTRWKLNDLLRTLIDDMRVGDLIKFIMLTLEIWMIYQSARARDNCTIKLLLANLGVSEIVVVGTVNIVLVIVIFKFFL